jgi:nucleotide-binding universal stress UspA family protein
MVPMDFSQAAKKAFRYAQDLARRYRAQIILLHVVTPSEQRDGTRAMSEAKQNLARLCQVKSVLPKLCKSVVQTGIPFLEITQSADLNEVGLIVLGRRNATSPGRIGSGHTSDRVMRYAKCPVLIVNETSRDFVVTPTGD